MNKSVLFLINGFGMQQRDSFDIFDNDFMTNLTNNVNKYLYTSLVTKSFDYKDGYSELSTGSNTSISYSFIDKEVEEKKYVNNAVLNEMIEKAKTSKMQIFCTLDDINTFYHLREYLEYINKKTDKQVILNLILRQKDFSQYTMISKVVEKIALELSPYARLGMVIGEDNLNVRETRDYIRIMYTEVAEIWHETAKKFESLANNEISPKKSKPFVVNKGFKFENNDILFFFNHDDLAMDIFLSECNFNPITRENYNFLFFSLFPITSKREVKSIYPLPTSDISLAINLKSINQKALILCEEDKIDNINYYCNGYIDNATPSLAYGILNSTNEFDKETLKLFIANPEFKLVIINYDIDKCNDLTSLKNRLNKIDEMIKEVTDICLANSYTLLISSLYGINRKVIDDQGIYRNINLSTKVPVIMVDKKYPKAGFSLGEGNIYLLNTTIYKLLNPSYAGDTLFMKKGFLSKMIKKG